MSFIYLDYAATTQVCPQAAQAALTAMTEDFGNPSSRHALGSAAARRLREDRAAVARRLGCAPEELFFTSCGTEGDNWAIRSAVRYGRHSGRHIVTTSVEHAAVLETMKDLAAEGCEVTYLKPDSTGHISVASLEAALRLDTVLVSMMLVNNETGARFPVAEAARAIRRAGAPALLHTDAVQAFCKVPFTPAGLGADLVTLSGHKIGAPKGIGALYVKKSLQPRFRPLLLGGGQESGMRPGTEPTAQIAAFAAACEAYPLNTDSIESVKDYFLDLISSAIPDAVLVSRGDTPHICAVSLPGYPSEMLVRALSDRGICVSSGSACHRGKPSHVFAALGLPKPVLTGILRVSFGPGSTRTDADGLVSALVQIQSERMAAR